MSRKVIGGAALAIALIALSGCGGAETPPAAGTDEATPSSASAAPTSAALNESNCQDPDFYDANVEFCAGGGFEPGGGSSFEGSVTDPNAAFVLQPDGLRVEIATVTAGPTTIGNADPAEDAQVVVTVVLTNTGQETIALPDAGGYVVDDLFYGENRYDAQQWFNPDDSPGSSDLPQQLVPGTNTTFAATYTLPSAGLAALAFVVNPDNETYQDYTFTDVEALLG